MTNGRKKFEPTKPELTITFPSVEAAAAFKAWLCESGEQDYWNYTEINGPSCNFDYHNPGGSIIVATEVGDD
jgi:hypothetical protein